MHRDSDLMVLKYRSDVGAEVGRWYVSIGVGQTVDLLRRSIMHLQLPPFTVQRHRDDGRLHSVNLNPLRFILAKTSAKTHHHLCVVTAVHFPVLTAFTLTCSSVSIAFSAVMLGWASGTASGLKKN